MKMKYKIIALIGKAGSGKDTLLQNVLPFLPSSHEIISYTTRPKREGEIEGRNYRFITKEEFIQKIDSQEMLEYCIFNNWYYGTSISSFDKERINIGVFNLEGINSLSERNDIDLLVFYVTANDKIRLLRQLNREKNPDVDEIVRRFMTDEIDFINADENYNTITLENNSPKDIQKCVDIMLREAQTHFCARTTQVKDN